MLRERVLTGTTHVIGWLLFFGLLAGFFYNFHPELNVWSLILNPAFLFFMAAYLFVYYFNTLLLVPYLYLRKKYLVYALAIAVLLVVIYFVKPFDRLLSSFNRFPEPENFPGPGMPDIDFSPGNGPGPGPGEGFRKPPEANKSIFKTDIVSIVLYVMVTSLGLALCMIREWRTTVQRALRAETEKAHAELSFLKAQINPHFLFNTLNNIYSMVVVKHDRAADAVMKLSNIMRYITDEIRTDLVPLESEIGCMEDYIELQRMRLGAKTEIQAAFSGNTGGEQIAPLLLMTFVENAFKYGVSNHEQALIQIRLEVQDPVIRFTCRNTLFPVSAHAERTGIGISNASRRLEHLYPNRHKLDISTADGYYTVQLLLQSH